MNRVLALGPHGEGWVLLQGIVLVAVGAAGVNGLFNPSWIGVQRLVTSVGGTALLVLGALQIRRGARDLGTNLTPLPRPVGDATLVDTGIYGRVRHPIYGGLILAGFGWTLLGASAAGLVVAALLVPLFWLKSTVEERWLEERFPSYPDYRRRTRRFIDVAGAPRVRARDRGDRSPPGTAQ
jgi:protein-S-isoprenylcysteine O-methyltransferase Ste14